jgi:hypothetical protein
MREVMRNFRALPPEERRMLRERFEANKQTPSPR